MSAFIALLLILPLPTPEVARGELHLAAEACFASLVTPPPAATPFLDWEQTIWAGCGPFIAAAGCAEAPLHACVSGVAGLRRTYSRVVAALTDASARRSGLIWLQGSDLPRPFDVYTAAASGEISAVEMHAYVIAGLLTRHLAFP